MAIRYISRLPKTLRSRTADARCPATRCSNAGISVPGGVMQVMRPLDANIRVNAPSLVAVNASNSVTKTVRLRAIAKLLINRRASSREETPLEQLDEENAARLFGEADAAVGTDNMKLVRRRDDGEGGIREVWKGTYTVRVNDGKRADASLLD
ncbi:uncharacterized protein KY384_000632 [Bacidia gigantensis]|uniref:uncharacterized protein n=1 Tax=Bacidia gigantensis TaxID=2732470 RepID=UPI001D05A06E|nr:uncharacterized protein KY384_000632 [Bacidia gigantensis]KAG8525872.1 hypothetical protein KY384_000632 [Bacidia gigantensis]